jgi:hypothetical protein
MLVEHLKTMVTREDSRSASLVRLHYGNELPEQLESNVTTLRNFHNDVRKLQATVVNASSLNETLLHFLRQSGKFSSRVDVDESQYDDINHIVKQTEKLWQTTDSFHGSVMVASGVQATPKTISSLATLWNQSANDLEKNSSLALNPISLAYNVVLASSVTAYRGRLLVQDATAISKQAQEATTDTSHRQRSFDAVQNDFTRELDSLTFRRDRLHIDLDDIGQSIENSSVTALTTNGTVRRALAHAQIVHSSTKQQTTDTERTKLDAEIVFYNACRTLNNTKETKVTANTTLSTAVATESRHVDLNSLLNTSVESLTAAYGIAADVVALPSLPITEIQLLSQQINKTIIPVVEVNSTAQQAADSMFQARDVLDMATKALNVSYTAATFVSGTEATVSNATDARITANRAMQDTRSTLAAARATKIKVQNATGGTKLTAEQSRNISHRADESIRLVGECRGAAISQLKGREPTTNFSCRVTSGKLLQNGSNVLSSSNTLNASAQADTDLTESKELQQSAIDLQKDVTRSLLIKEINELLEDYRLQRDVLKSQAKKLSLLGADLESLESSIDTNCAAKN